MLVVAAAAAAGVLLVTVQQMPVSGAQAGSQAHKQGGRAAQTESVDRFFFFFFHCSPNSIEDSFPGGFPSSCLPTFPCRARAGEVVQCSDRRRTGASSHGCPLACRLTHLRHGQGETP
jgi:hypothetical protein